ncbi:MAG TPA: CDP-alcohol phosphatidyltransferase family protein [Blastocatellia bacterium]|nr:CDP-alcohol phosphatidyltransferase family protein [Blastocatellia bacterium]
MISRFLGKGFQSVLLRLAQMLVRVGISPNLITVVGCTAGILSGVALARGEFLWGATAIAVVGLCDLLDGMVARAKNTQSRFGAFLDSALDRYADMAMLIGLILYFARMNRLDYLLICCLALVGTVMTSYARARAESVIGHCRVGFMERPERIVFLMLGILFNRVEQALWVIAVGANWTALQRIHYTWVVSSSRQQ